MRDTLQCIFCVCKANLLLTPLLFNSGINTVLQLQKKNSRRITFARHQSNLPKINLEDLFDWQVYFVPDGSKDTQLTVRTHCSCMTEQKCTKYDQPSDSVPGVLDMSPF